MPTRARCYGLQASAAKKNVKILLPTDVVIADKFDAAANTQIVSVDSIPDGWMGLDIGPDSIKNFQKELMTCKVLCLSLCSLLLYCLSLCCRLHCATHLGLTAAALAQQ